MNSSGKTKAKQPVTATKMTIPASIQERISKGLEFDEITLNPSVEERNIWQQLFSLRQHMACSEDLVPINAYTWMMLLRSTRFGTTSIQMELALKAICDKKFIWKPADHFFNILYALDEYGKELPEDDRLRAHWVWFVRAIRRLKNDAYDSFLTTEEFIAKLKFRSDDAVVNIAQLHDVFIEYLREHHLFIAPTIESRSSILELEMRVYAKHLLESGMITFGAYENSLLELEINPDSLTRENLQSGYSLTLLFKAFFLSLHLKPVTA